MNRTEMVKARAKKLSEMSDVNLVDAIVKYFEENAAMPGEKALKDFAISLKTELDAHIGVGLLSQTRMDLIEEFSSLCVKEVKLKNVRAVNETKKNADLDAVKAGDLPMVLADAKLIPVNTMKNVYEMNGMINGDEDGHRFVNICDAKDGSFEFAALPGGFQKNHALQHGMDVTVIASDYSNGKFANMSYTMLIDLGQKIAV